MDKNEVKQIILMITVGIALAAFFVGVLWLVLKINHPYVEEKLSATLRNTKGVWYGKFN